MAAEPPEETPDWIKDLAGHELDEPGTPAKAESEADWLGKLQAEEGAAEPVEPAADELPAWLKEFDNDLETPIAKEAEPAAPEPAAPEAAAPEPPAAGLGLLGTTAQEQDDAMAWLESLAAKHGAKPEELVTDPNARTDVAPEWVDKAKEMGEQPAETPPAEDETGIWLRSLAADAEKAEAPTPAPEEPAEETPLEVVSFEEQTEFTGTLPEAGREELSIEEEPETPDWLRDFASKAAERPGMEDAPDWLRGVSQEEQETPRTQADVPTAPLRGRPESEPTASRQEPREEGGMELPAWLAGLENEEPSASPSAPAEPSSEELPSWLQSEAEPEPEAKQPANPADWHPAQAKPAEVQPPLSETKPEPAQAEQPVSGAGQEAREAAKPVGEIELPPVEQKPVEVPPVREAKPQPVEEKPAPAPEPVHAEKAPPPAPARPKPSPVPAKPGAPSLGDAQTQLGRGNIAAALDIYTKLIRKGKSLEEIIRDLRDALYRYPVEVPLWQSLGDAYMRANRLQEALDAYTKAEELLR